MTLKELYRDVELKVFENQEDKGYRFFEHDEKAIIQKLGKETLLEDFKKMLLIRNFEKRGESAYQHGKIGGFYHSYVGQEAIQTSAIQAFGKNNWWVAGYRIHALSLLLDIPVKDIFAELYGKANGNSLGRGGSMHLYSDRFLGGFGIVTNQVPVSTGAAFSLKYKNIKDEAAICFLGDGAVAGGAFHEALNLASLWDLPCIYIIENNQWGMGTKVNKAISVPRLAEDKAAGYNMKAYTLNGMNYFNCYAAFDHIYKEVLETSRPVLVEAVCHRYRGHSISDPGLYRSKEELKEKMAEDPIFLMQHELMEAGMITEDEVKAMDKEVREIVIEAMDYADKSPWPDPVTLEEDVFAP